MRDSDSVEVDVERLVPCSGCDRHVKVSERACPFCERELDFEGLAPMQAIGERLGRARLRKLGLSAVGLSIFVSCVEEQHAVAVYGAPGTGSGAGASSAGGTSSGKSGGAGGTTSDGGAAGAADGGESS